MENEDQKFQELIPKLPKYAQDKIKQIMKERDAAIENLNEFLDNQTVSGICAEETVYTGKGHEVVKRYVQGDKVVARQNGVEVRLSLYQDHRNIEIQYSREGRLTGDILLTPVSYQHLRFTMPENAY